LHSLLPTNNMTKYFRLILALLALTHCEQLFSQCIVLNEIMINAAGPNDGSNSPNTAEWVELYNTCSEPVDIGCMVIGDGDFTVTIPIGTILQPGEYFTIGSINAGFVVDLDWGTCGCTDGSGIGIFSNNNEQLALIDANGQLVDGIYWGAGQLPLDINTPGMGTCNGVSANGLDTPDLTLLPASGGQGCSISLACDGGSTWLETCTPTPAAANGSAIISPTFSATDQNICVGECLDFTDTSTETADSWAWSFEGSGTPTSSDQNPAGICYSEPGSFDVILTLTTNCGVFTTTETNYITVGVSPEPIIDPSGPLEFCDGSEVTFTTTEAGTYQWLLNGEAIPNETGNSYTASSTGNYSVQVTNGSCSAISNSYDVVVASSEGLDITPSGVISICEGADQLLSVDMGFTSYQWMLNGSNIDGANSNTYTANQSGIYTVEVTVGNCSATSSSTEINFENAAVVTLNPNEDLAICTNGSVDLNAIGNFDDYQWYQNGTVIPGANSNTFQVTEAGDYYVSVNNSGCSGESESVAITVNPGPTPSLSLEGLNTFCTGEIQELFADQNYSVYQWFYDGNVVMGETGSSFTASESGTYMLSVMDENGCVALTAMTTIIYVDPLPVVITPGAPFNTCQPVDLNAESIGEIQWYFNGVLIPGETSPTYTATQTGSYSVVAISDVCPPQTDEVTITFNGSLDVQILADNSTPCDGTPVQLSLQGIYESVLWSNGQQTDVITVSSDGTYSAVVTANNCSTEIEYELNFHTLPEVDAGNDTVGDCALGTLLLGTGTGTLIWETSPTLEDLGNGSAVVTPLSNTTYILTTSDGVCVAKDEVMVLADCSSIFIPNIFTPNGDGINEVFEVEVRGTSQYELKIFNRWGVKIFESTNPDQPWTGGGDYYVPDGVYFWTIVAINLNNEPMLDEGHSHGTVTVVR
jgi:gliding motility-associated-like protein